MLNRYWIDVREISSWRWKKKKKNFENQKGISD